MDVDLPLTCQPDALRPVVPGARWIHLSPAGGERYGDLTVVCLPRDGVPDLDTAVVALWKLAWCIVEEWPYEVWSEPPDHAIAELRALTPLAFDGVPDDDADFTWLRDRAREVVEAQRTVAKPRNPWRSSPGEERDLAELAFVRAGRMRRKLETDWYDMRAVFVDGDAVYLVGWSTSA